MAEEGIVVGIDLGTTFSTISYYNEINKKPELIRDPSNEHNVPSWISFEDYQKTGRIVVGKQAKVKGMGDDVIYDSKRMIGREFQEINPEEKDNKWPFEVRNVEGPCIVYKDKKGNDDLIYPEEVSGLILKHLIDSAKARTGKSIIKKIIVTVPAEFKDKQKNSTLFACQLAFKGLNLKKNQIELLNEPSAAILEYKRFLAEKEMEPLKENAKVVVIDFGGGTLDIDCCLCTKGTVRVESNGGDQDLGGNNFDTVMMELIKEKLKEDGTLDENYFEKPKGKRVGNATLNQHKKRVTYLRKEAERIKMLLSKRSNVSIKMENLLGNEYNEEDHADIEIEISRKAFENACEKKGLYKKFTAALKKVLNKKSYTKANVDAILLIGGACLMPKIKEEVGKALDINKVVNTEEFDPLTAVSMGAAWYGYNQTSAIASDDFYETIPYPIGLEVNGGKFDQFCDACEQLPIKTKKVYSLQHEGQQSADFNVFRGTSTFVNSPGMDALGSFTIEGIPVVKGKVVSIGVLINIGTDGRVNIDAECEEIAVSEEEKQQEQQKEGEEGLDEGQVVNAKKELKGGMILEMDFSKKSRHQEEIMDHFAKLSTTGPE